MHSEFEVRPGEEGRARAKVQGKGSNLGVPVLPLSGDVLFQLRAVDAACWEASFEPDDISRNDAGWYAGQSD